MAATNPAPRRLVRAGLVLFAVGLLLLGADVVPFLFGHRNQPTVLAVGSYATVAGMLLGLLGLRAYSRHRRRRLVHGLRGRPERRR